MVGAVFVRDDAAGPAYMPGQMPGYPTAHFPHARLAHARPYPLNGASPSRLVDKLISLPSGTNKSIFFFRESF